MFAGLQEEYTHFPAQMAKTKIPVNLPKAESGDKFISFLQLKGFTKATIRNYIQSIKRFQDWLGKSSVHVL
jgi:SOS response regulatory protein OraA/RecX